MLTGKGNQKFLTKSYLEDRRKALEDRDKYTDETLEKLELDDKPAHGGGRTNPDSYEIWQFPFPLDQSVRQRKKVDLRDVDPTIGGK